MASNTQECIIEPSIDPLNLDEPGVRFSFISEAPLQSWFRKRGWNGEPFMLQKAFHFMIKWINQENMFDPTNRSMILTNLELQAVINRNGLHISELRGIFMRQVRETQYISGFGMMKKRYTLWRFHIQPNFCDVLEINKTNRKEYTYAEIISLFCKYINANKHILLDERNRRIVHSRGTKLGVAFRVNSFHGSQVAHLIDTQLIASTLKGLAAHKIIKTMLKTTYPSYNGRIHNRFHKNVILTMKRKIKQLEIPETVEDFLLDFFNGM